MNSNQASAYARAGSKVVRAMALGLGALVLALPALAEGAGAPLAGRVPVAVGPVPVDFILFALTLLPMLALSAPACTRTVTIKVPPQQWRTILLL